MNTPQLAEWAIFGTLIIVWGWISIDLNRISDAMKNSLKGVILLKANRRTNVTIETLSTDLHARTLLRMYYVVSNMVSKWQGRIVLACVAFPFSAILMQQFLYKYLNPEYTAIDVVRSVWGILALVLSILFGVVYFGARKRLQDC